MESRYYDANLIWAMAKKAALAELKKIGHSAYTLTTHDPKIYIYADGLLGALLVQHGKLYLDEDTSDQYFANTDKKISDHEGKIREVIVKFGKNSTAFATYEDFIAWVKS